MSLALGGRGPGQGSRLPVERACFPPGGRRAWGGGRECPVQGHRKHSFRVRSALISCFILERPGIIMQHPTWGFFRKSLHINT